MQPLPFSTLASKDILEVSPSHILVGDTPISFFQRCTQPKYYKSLSKRNILLVFMYM